MDFKVYVWIDGDQFDPKGFNDSLGANLKGAARTGSRLVGGRALEGRSYWMSEVVNAHPEAPEESLTKLLTTLKPELARICDLPGIRIVAELVVRYEDTDPLRGFYFSRKLIDILAEVGASVDVDVVRNLQSDW